jgi:uncharacterized protein YbjQ (UPF0145 family)
MISLSINAEPSESHRTDHLIFTTDSVQGKTITRTIGIVEGLSNGMFTEVKHGSLEKLLKEAKSHLAERALSSGGNAVVGVRYEVVGRDIEKTILIYGTAVHLE